MIPTNSPVNRLINRLRTSDSEQFHDAFVELHHRKYEKFFKTNVMAVASMLHDRAPNVREAGASIAASFLSYDVAKDLVSSAHAREKQPQTKAGMHEILEGIKKPVQPDQSPSL